METVYLIVRTGFASRFPFPMCVCGTREIAMSKMLSFQKKEKNGAIFTVEEIPYVMEN